MQPPDWRTGVTYLPGEVVMHDGTAWWVLGGHTSTQPPPNDAHYKPNP